MLLQLFRLISQLPLPVLRALGTSAGWLVYASSPRYRARLKQNLAQAGYAPDNRALRRAVIGDIGRGAVELAYVWMRPAEEVLARVEVHGWEHVEAARQARRGIVFLTPHLGCFEVIAQFIATRVPLTALYRPPRKAALKPLVEGARARAHLKLASADRKGVVALVRALKAGETTGILPDQVPQAGEGTWAPFFGKPAWTMTLPGKLARSANALIIPVWAERVAPDPARPGIAWRMHFCAWDALMEGAALAEDPAAQAAQINHMAEKMIALCPAQYLWSYDRYKTPKGVAPSSLSTAASTNVGAVNQAETR
jgi:KDO2-lipid IV(A) lauroyltransferase